MSRIGKKPIPLPAGVKFDIVGSNVVVQGPKGKVTTHLPAGVKLQTANGHINVIRENDDRAAVHGLVRALVNNAVEGVTRGWTRDLEIMGIGYREAKGLFSGAIGESGGVMKSPISPFIFACSRLDDELAKALFRICIMISPGATKAP